MAGVAPPVGIIEGLIREERDIEEKVAERVVRDEEKGLTEVQADAIANNLNRILDESVGRHNLSPNELREIKLETLGFINANMKGKSILHRQNIEDRVKNYLNTHNIDPRIKLVVESTILRNIRDAALIKGREIGRTPVKVIPFNQAHTILGRELLSTSRKQEMAGTINIIEQKIQEKIEDGIDPDDNDAFKPALEDAKVLYANLVRLSKSLHLMEKMPNGNIERIEPIKWSLANKKSRRRGPAMNAMEYIQYLKGYINNYIITPQEGVFIHNPIFDHGEDNNIDHLDNITGAIKQSTAKRKSSALKPTKTNIRRPVKTTEVSGIKITRDMDGDSEIKINTHEVNQIDLFKLVHAIIRDAGSIYGEGNETLYKFKPGDKPQKVVKVLTEYMKSPSNKNKKEFTFHVVWNDELLGGSFVGGFLHRLHPLHNSKGSIALNTYVHGLIKRHHGELLPKNINYF